jgi:hypothetical protein
MKPYNPQGQVFRFMYLTAAYHHGGASCQYAYTVGLEIGSRILL